MSNAMGDQVKNGLRWIKRIVFLIAIAAIYIFIAPVRTFIDQAVILLSTLNVGAVKEYLLSFGYWAPLISFFLMVFQSVAAPIPAFVLTFANAALFGWIYGALLSWTSAMAGAALCFLIARYYGREAVEKLTSRFALKKMDDFFQRHGQYAVLVARLLPFVSFDVVSYAAGLTPMGFWRFFWATGLGQLPATLIYSYVGDMLTGGVKYLVMGLLTVFALSVLIFMVKKVYGERQQEK